MPQTASNQPLVSELKIIALFEHLQAIEVDMAKIPSKVKLEVFDIVRRVHHG